MLAYSSLHAPDQTPARWMVFLHGILGSGSNWQGFARHLCAARPEWGAVLVDLRMHGDSQAEPGPHTLAAAAEDVRAVMRAVGAELGEVHAVIGHSFGGKVAMALLEPRPASLDEVWVLDASPSARPVRTMSELTPRVLAALSALPPLFASRNQFVTELEAHGIETAIARWLAKNLVSDGEGWRFGLDLGAIQELLADYGRTDVWSLVESAAPEVALRFVLAGHGSVVNAADRQRLQALAANGALELHTLVNAGHFLHVDDPDGLLALLVDGLRGTE